MTPRQRRKLLLVLYRPASRGRQSSFQYNLYHVSLLGPGGGGVIGRKIKKNSFHHRCVLFRDLREIGKSPQILHRMPFYFIFIFFLYIYNEIASKGNVKPLAELRHPNLEGSYWKKCPTNISICVANRRIDSHNYQFVNFSRPNGSNFHHHIF